MTDKKFHVTRDEPEGYSVTFENEEGFKQWARSMLKTFKQSDEEIEEFMKEIFKDKQTSTLKCTRCGAEKDSEDFAAPCINERCRGTMVKKDEHERAIEDLHGEQIPRSLSKGLRRRMFDFIEDLENCTGMGKDPLKAEFWEQHKITDDEKPMFLALLCQTFRETRRNNPDIIKSAACGEAMI